MKKEGSCKYYLLGKAQWYISKVYKSMIGLKGISN